MRRKAILKIPIAFNNDVNYLKLTRLRDSNVLLGQPAVSELIHYLKKTAEFPTYATPQWNKTLYTFFGANSLVLSVKYFSKKVWKVLDTQH